MLSLSEDVSDGDIIKHLEELTSKNTAESTIDDDTKPSLVRRSQSSDSISRRSNQQTNITLKKFPAIRTSKSRPKTTFIKWK